VAEHARAAALIAARAREQRTVDVVFRLTGTHTLEVCRGGAPMARMLCGVVCVVVDVRCVASCCFVVASRVYTRMYG
jgi:hypothetical protein